MNKKHIFSVCILIVSERCSYLNICMCIESNFSSVIRNQGTIPNNSEWGEWERKSSYETDKRERERGEELGTRETPM